MGDEDDGLVVFLEVFKVFFTFLLEGGVTDGEDFVEKEDVAAGADGDREGEADLHTGAVIFQLLVLEFFKFGEFPNVVVHFIHFLVRETKKSAVHINVFASGELRIKANAELNKRNECTVYGDVTFFWVVNAGEDFEKGGFARAIFTNDAKKFTLFNFEIKAF